MNARALVLLASFAILGCRTLPTGASDAGTLPTPFSADQIRDAMVEGLRMTLHMQVEGGEQWERWTVLAHDDEGVEIEFAPVDDEGFVTGYPRKERNTWTALRDHAKFASDRAHREPTKKSTRLGTFEGWTYVVSDPTEGTVTEFFFANECPGPPLEFETKKDGATLVKMEVVARKKLAQ